jgi:hypothetical protein
MDLRIEKAAFAFEARLKNVPKEGDVLDFLLYARTP